MKLASIGAALAAVGLGLAVAKNPTTREPVATTGYPPGCTVSIGAAPGYLPRAGVTIENHTAAPLRVWLEARNGLARVEYGLLGEGEIRVLGHALPAGRNLLQAAPERGGTAKRIVLNVAHHGAATCKRRYVWRIE